MRSIRPRLARHACPIARRSCVFACTYATMRAAQRLTKLLGKTGIDAISRVVGIIVAAIAIQFIVDDIVEIAKSL